MWQPTIILYNAGNCLSGDCLSQPPSTKSWIRPGVGSGGKAEKLLLLAIFHLRLVWETAGYSKDSFQGLASPNASWVLDR